MKSLHNLVKLSLVTASLLIATASSAENVLETKGYKYCKKTENIDECVRNANKVVGDFAETFKRNTDKTSIQKISFNAQVLTKTDPRFTDLVKFCSALLTHKLLNEKHVQYLQTNEVNEFAKKSIQKSELDSMLTRLFTTDKSLVETTSAEGKSLIQHKSVKDNALSVAKSVFQFELEAIMGHCETEIAGLRHLLSLEMDEALQEIVAISNNTQILADDMGDNAIKVFDACSNIQVEAPVTENEKQTAMNTITGIFVDVSNDVNGIATRIQHASTDIERRLAKDELVNYCVRRKNDIAKDLATTKSWYEAVFALNGKKALHIK